jgi:HlyD family secretion protein
MDPQIETRPAPRQVSPPPAGELRPPRRRRSGRLFALLLLFLLAAAIAAGWWKMQSPTSVHSVTAPVTRGTVARTVTATGTVNPELTIIVGSYVSGVIQKLYCDYNTTVKPGQVCAKIDPRPYQTVVDQDKANLAVAKAQLEKDKANLAYAKANYERNRRLAERGAVSQDTADLAKSTYDQARAQIGLDAATIEQRSAALEAAEVNLGYTNIISPVNGTVVSRNVTQGQTVAASFQTPTLFLIATDLTKMEVDTNVSEADVGGVREGDAATFTVDAFPKRIFAGKVTQVRQSPQMVQNVVTYDAVVSLDNRDLALKPGMTASTRIITEERKDVLRVPNEALRYAPGGLASARAPPPAAGEARLWVLRDGRPVSVPVSLGLENDAFTEIVKGELQAGDRVVVAERHGATGGQDPPSRP